VVSIGNLHWGGTGKTPVVAALARHLRDRGRHVAILSRGYRGRGRGVRLVSAGAGPLLGPLVAGDEPVLLAGELAGVAVLVGPDRHEAGRHALERLDPPPDIFLLDDGFSHLRLARDLDLLALPVDDPWGGGRLFPSGRLREPLAAAARADAVVLTGLTGDPAGMGTAVAASLRTHGFTGPGFGCVARALPPRWYGGPRTEHGLAPGARVVAVAAIARPARFLCALADHPLTVVGTLLYPDHHPYPDATLKEIEAAVRRSGADGVLATSKDRVKLSGRLGVPLAELPVAAEPEAAFWEWLDARLAAGTAARGAPRS
jgi:tetraacyldisaccharide 4'-kinase